MSDLADEDTNKDQIEETVEVTQDAPQVSEESRPEDDQPVADISEAPVAESAEEAAEVIEEAQPQVAEETPKVKKESKAVSKDLEKIIESIEKLSVLELSDLVHALEDRFGVTAAAPMAVAGAGVAAGTGEVAEEQTTFNVILSSAGANKIGAIKAVRELVPTLGLKEAKDLVEAAPKPVLEGVNKATAEEAKAKLTAAGATVDLQ